ncbi:MAG TPA: serpin family protein, partial [Pyrinomonadaceae bacterium]|nr:serpin family protein [Pyrinomonadaceae bacterium]
MLHFQSTKILVATLIALIVCANVTPTRSQNQVDNRLTTASAKFSFKLYDQLLKSRKTENTFASPASVMLALAMTYNGANGTTRESMARTLELEGMSLEDVNRAFADLKS